MSSGAAEIRSFSGRKLGPLWFAAQGTSCLLWWSLLFVEPSWINAFTPASEGPVALRSLAVADVVMVGLGSLASAFLLSRASPVGLLLAWLTAGATAYAALITVGWALIYGEPWLPVALMLPAASLSIVFAADWSAGLLSVFATAGPATADRNVRRTLAQTTVMWAVFLAILPAGILFLEGRLRVQVFEAPGQVAIAALVFLCASALGLWSGVTMARIGRGTPLPSEAPRRLVIAGPYSHVRNPMAIAGLIQGAAVGLATGSWGVLIYVMAGGLLWNSVARPAEEADLAERFGASYARYRREVRCWWPRRTPWRGPE